MDTRIWEEVERERERERGRGRERKSYQEYNYRRLEKNDIKI